jgi:hypothetical protein
MKSKLSEKVATLKAALETVNHQIKNLKPFYSAQQVRCWYLHRNKLVKDLNLNEAMLKAQSAVSVVEFVRNSKSKFQK